MKKLLALLLALLMLLGGAAFAEETGLTKDIVVLFTSDVHCGIDQGFGYAGLAAVRDTLEETSHVLLVDNGDAVQGEPIGTMTTGEAIIPYISANFNKDGELVFDPYVIEEIEGVKVAFVGITTPKTITSSTPKYFQDDEGNFIYGFMQDETGEKLYAAVQSAVDAAIAEGADYVIAMAHLGNEATCAPYTYADVIANTTGIDAFLDGHSHDTDQVVMQNKDGEDVPRSGCGTKMGGIGYARISAADGSIQTGLYTWTNDVSVPALLGIENDITTAVAEATETLDEKLNEVVAKSDVELTINDPEAVDENGQPIRIIRNAETNLGDLCADAYRDQGEADVAFVNGGGIRVSIPAGDITLGDILQVHPFGNALCVVEATGQQILDALEWGARNVPGENGGFLQVSGLTYEIHTYIESSCTADENGLFTGVDGEYRVKNVKVAGEDLDLTKTYTVASHNYMLKDGGDGFTMFQGCNLLQDEIKLDNQVLIDYITGTLEGVVGEQYANPYGEGRIVGVAEAE